MVEFEAILGRRSFLRSGQFTGKFSSKFISLNHLFHISFVLATVGVKSLSPLNICTFDLYELKFWIIFVYIK